MSFRDQLPPHTAFAIREEEQHHIDAIREGITEALRLFDFNRALPFWLKLLMRYRGPSLLSTPSFSLQNRCLLFIFIFSRFPISPNFTREIIPLLTPLRVSVCM